MRHAVPPEGLKRTNLLRTAARASADDDPEGLSPWERCITRGLPVAMLPIGYNNNFASVLFRDSINDVFSTP